MKRWRIVVLLVASLCCLNIYAQNNGQRQTGNKNNSQIKSNATKQILPHVKAWHMADEYTVADTAVVDTIIAEHQVNNVIWRQSISNVTLGNLGSPSISTLYPTIRKDNGNIFYNALEQQILNPEDFTFYNTLTPYSNLTYQKGIPKSEREEFFSAMYTQNVNKKVNIGAKLEINSSIGRYQNYDAYNRKFGFWASVDGDVYKMQLQAWYQRFELYENGGITNDNYVLYPDSFDYEPEDIPVNFMDATNRLASYRLLLAQSLDIGQVTRTEGDSVEFDVPVATAYYKFYIDRSHHDFTIDDLSDYAEVFDDLFPNLLTNLSQTRDNRKYMLLSNLVQLRLNEEFNSLLRFGLRAYLGNEVRQYYWNAASDFEYDEDDNLVTTPHRSKKNKVSSYVGGQIFKNIGTRLRWNAGIKLYFQGYNTGDLNANGKIDVTIGNGRWATDVWAKANIELRSPSVWEEDFTSNHYTWSQSLDREKSIDIQGGIRIPGVNLEITAFSATLTDKIYFNEDGIPSQKSDVTQLIGAYARLHLISPIGFNSIIRVAVQNTSDNDVLPAPTFALYATNFWEHKFFNVLVTQIGFDVRYNTKYYTPKYITPIMQFVPQHEREIGNYGYFDPYVNFHLKKIRAYFKYEHVNYYWGSNDHFHTIHYPANPGTFKFGLSWNFYD